MLGCEQHRLIGELLSSGPMPSERGRTLRRELEAAQTARAVAAAEVRKAQDAAEALRQADEARKARGRWARLRAGWRGE